MLNQVSIGDTDLGSNKTLLPIFVISFGIGSFLIIRTKRTLDNATSIVNTISVVFITVIIAMVGIEAFGCDECLIQQTYSLGIFSNQIMDSTLYFEEHSFSVSESDSLPNVYYIILDGYPRNDVLKKHLDFDNSEFIDFLKQREFYVAENSYSNYSLSSTSIPATMNMNYINFLADELGEDSRSYDPLLGKDFGLYADNQVIKNFKSMGYKVAKIGSVPMYLHEMPLADLSLCYKSIHLMDNRLFDTVARTSMIGYFIERWSEDLQRQIILCAFEELPKISSYYEEPVFAWSHIMIPHFPLIFGADGEPVTPGESLLVMNNPHLFEGTDSSWNIKQQFLQQLQFANKKSMELVDKILENEKQSIIIIQSDHGSAFDVDLDDPTDDDVHQRLSNINAIYFPDEKPREILMNDQTNVNTFRIVFNSYFGSDYDILEDKIYWNLSFKKPFWFKDVTSVLLN
tara:strand:+ start:37 stop:1410 length:1374 start_codon:yes stop_codon:yes gene_type:complete